MRKKRKTLGWWSFEDHRRKGTGPNRWEHSCKSHYLLSTFSPHIAELLEQD